MKLHFSSMFLTSSQQSHLLLTLLHFSTVISTSINLLQFSILISISHYHSLLLFTTLPLPLSSLSFHPQCYLLLTNLHFSSVISVSTLQWYDFSKLRDLDMYPLFWCRGIHWFGELSERGDSITSGKEYLRVYSL